MIDVGTVWPGVLCTWPCEIHCVPRQGGTALSGMQHGTGAHCGGSRRQRSGLGAVDNALRSTQIFRAPHYALSGLFVLGRTGAGIARISRSSLRPIFSGYGAVSQEGRS